MSEEAEQVNEGQTEDVKVKEETPDVSETTEVNLKSWFWRNC